MSVDGKAPALPAPSERLADAVRELGAGRLTEAARLLDEALAAAPDDPAALQLRGVVAHRHGDLAAAARWLGRAVAIDGASAQAWFNLGVVLMGLWRPGEAIAAYRRAVELDPGHVDALCNIGVWLMDRGRLAEAVDTYRRALAADPDNARVWNNLGIALKNGGHRDRAVGAYRRAIALEPGYVNAWNNLGVALKELDRPEDAVAAYRRALALDPGHAGAWSNLGTALMELRRTDEAEAACRRALALAPELPDAHLNLSLVLLSKGAFAEGWREFEWRWRERQQKRARRAFARPEWDGSPLAGRAILLHAEQGLGDTIQFIRYARLVKDAGAGAVIVDCPAALRTLAATAAGVDAVVRPGRRAPPFDLHCPLLGLPRLFRTELATIPARVPYLRAPERVDSPVGEGGGGLRVGLAWAGNPRHHRDVVRSLDVAFLEPLFAVPGVRFFGLQVGERAGEARRHAWASSLIDLSPRLSDMAVTAAAMADLDLVISADTAVAHLAGALARPAWTLLPFAPDFRWLLDGDGSPWYPTMRLFRQHARGDWPGVVARVAAALRERAAASGAEEPMRRPL